MADLKISALTSAGALAGTEPLPIVQGGTTKKTTAQDIANLKASWDSTLVSSSLTAVLSTQYVVVASATFTDPSPVEGKGFQVYVRNGTATIGGVGYSVAGTIIYRVFHSGSWATYFQSAFNDATSSIQTQLNSKQATLVSATNIKTINGNSVLGSGNLVITASGTIISNCADGTAITGVTTNQYSKGLLIPANSRGANDAPQAEITALKTGSNGNVTIRMYWNTTNDLAGSPILLGTFGPIAANFSSMVRVLMIQVANGTGNATRTTNATGSTAVGWGGAGFSAASTVAINWTIDGYLICAVQNTSGSDSTVSVMVKLN